jgi:hypothetical protein
MHGFGTQQTNRRRQWILPYRQRLTAASARQAIRTNGSSSGPRIARFGLIEEWHIDVV